MLCPWREWRRAQGARVESLPGLVPPTRVLTSPGEDDEGGFQVPLEPAVTVDEVGHILRLG